MPKARLLRLFRVVYSGAHIGMNEVEYLQASRLRIVADPVMEVFADGEYICTTPIELGVQRAALKVIVPD
jgi:diacylglycerol kinase family enzyme